MLRSWICQSGQRFPLFGGSFSRSSLLYNCVHLNAQETQVARWALGLGSIITKGMRIVTMARIFSSLCAYTPKNDADPFFD